MDLKGLLVALESLQTWLSRVQILHPVVSLQRMVGATFRYRGPHELTVENCELVTASHPLVWTDE